MVTFFSMQGRYNRARYFWSQFSILVLVYGAPFGAGFARLLPTGHSATVIWCAMLIVGNALSALQIVARVHGCGVRGGRSRRELTKKTIASIFG